jgi:PKD repeat protein
MPVGARGRPPRAARARSAVTIALGGLLVLSLFGLAAPPSVRCSLPGDVGCPGGVLGPTPASGSNLTQWFDVTMYDYGFWIVNDVSGVNESSNWTLLAGYTAHVNATSTPPDSALGGTGAHGLGVLGDGINLQLFTSVGAWSNASFVVPSQTASGILVYCVNYCGSGHSGMNENVARVATPESAPSASATATPTSGSTPLTVNFSGSASGGVPPYTFVWSFGDGARTVGATVQHVYVQPGTYDARLDAYDANGVAGAANLTISAHLPPALGVAITPANATGPAPFTVHFSAAASGGSAPYTYLWIFGDGGSGNGAGVTHTYQNRGLFYAQAIATDATGRTGASFAEINVTSTRPSPLVLIVTLTPREGDLPLNVSGVASVSGGTGGYGPVTWEWGDGSTHDAGRSATHRYAAVPPGNVTVSVSTFDASGQSATNNSTVRLDPSASGRLVVAPHAGSVPTTITAALELSGGNGSFAPVVWDFGDGATVTGGKVQSHGYGLAGDYRLTASTSDSNGAPITASAWINLSRSFATHAGGVSALPGDSSPLVFLASFASLGLLALLAAGWWERREPPSDASPTDVDDAPEAPELGAPSSDDATATELAPPLPPRGRAVWLVVAFGGALLYWIWPMSDPMGRYPGVASAIGNLLWLGVVAAVGVAVIGPAMRAARRVDPTLRGDLRLAGSAFLFGLGWLVATGTVGVARPSTGPLTPGVLLVPLHGAFGTWPAVEFLAGGGGLEGFLTPETIGAAALVGLLSAGALRLARPFRSGPEALRMRERWGAGRTGLVAGAIAWLSPFAIIVGCCSTPGLFRLGGGAASAALPDLGPLTDLVDGGLLLLSLGALTLLLRSLARGRPHRGGAGGA